VPRTGEPPVPYETANGGFEVLAPITRSVPFQAGLFRE